MSLLNLYYLYNLSVSTRVNLLSKHHFKIEDRSICKNSTKIFINIPEDSVFITTDKSYFYDIFGLLFATGFEDDI